jgi:hypothetical protein
MPWKKFCANHETSMCTVVNFMYHHGAGCPDPVREANIMYSAHLAQMGLLYQLHSGDTSLSAEGWRFQGGHPRVDLNYTLPTLMAVLAGQSATSRIGGGITCEPGSVYPSCNNHVYASFRLHDAMNGTSMGRRAPEWYGYMVNRTYNISHIVLSGGRENETTKQPVGNAAAVTRGDSNGSLTDWGGRRRGDWERRRRKKRDASNDPLFRIISVLPLARYIHDRNGIPFEGCAAHDGWVLSWLNAWSPQNQTSDMMSAWLDVVSENLHYDPAHDPALDGNVTGAWLNDTCRGQENRLTSLLATSWAPLVARQLASEGCPLCDSVYTHFERHYSALGDSVGDGEYNDMFHYDTNSTVGALATANLALSMAVMGPNNTMASLMGPEAVREYAVENPVLAHVPWPAVMVRRARYVGASRELSFTVLPSRGSVHGATLVCEGYDALLDDDHAAARIAVWRDGAIYRDWSDSVVGGRRQLQIKSDVVADTVFRVAWQ